MTPRSSLEGGESAALLARASLIHASEGFDGQARFRRTALSLARSITRGEAAAAGLLPFAVAEDGVLTAINASTATAASLDPTRADFAGVARTGEPSSAESLSIAKAAAAVGEAPAVEAPVVEARGGASFRSEMSMDGERRRLGCVRSSQEVSEPASDSCEVGSF